MWFVAGTVLGVASAVAGRAWPAVKTGSPATGTAPGMTRMHEWVLGEDSEISTGPSPA